MNNVVFQSKAKGLSIVETRNGFHARNKSCSTGDHGSRVEALIAGAGLSPEWSDATTAELVGYYASRGNKGD